MNKCRWLCTITALLAAITTIVAVMHIEPTITKTITYDIDMNMLSEETNYDMHHMSDRVVLASILGLFCATLGYAFGFAIAQTIRWDYDEGRYYDER